MFPTPINEQYYDLMFEIFISMSSNLNSESMTMILVRKTESLSGPRQSELDYGVCLLS